MKKSKARARIEKRMEKKKKHKVQTLFYKDLRFVHRLNGIIKREVWNYPASPFSTCENYLKDIQTPFMHEMRSQTTMRVNVNKRY